MKKNIMIILVCTVQLTNTAAYRSTEEALKDILNTGNSILQEKTLYDQKVITQLKILSQKLNTYVMHKQSLLVGKLSKGNTIESDNIFDVWSKALYDRVDMLINILESIVKKERSQKYQYSSITQLKEWNAKKTFKNEVIEKAQKIYTNAILDQKKKAAEITLFFAEHIVDIIQKALADYAVL